MQTDRGRLRLSSTVISPSPGEAYLVQVGELLDSVDRTLAGFDRLLLWRILGGPRRCGAARPLAGGPGADAAVPTRGVRLGRSASPTCTTGCRFAAPTTSSTRSRTPSTTRSRASNSPSERCASSARRSRTNCERPSRSSAARPSSSSPGQSSGRRPAGTAREPDRRIRSPDATDQPDPHAGESRGRRDQAGDGTRRRSTVWLPPWSPNRSSPSPAHAASR